MSFEEMVVVLVGSIGAFALFGYLSAKIFDLIKTWINRKNSGIPEEEFDRLARAFMDYKKDTQRRLKNLEAIIADNDLEEHSSEQKSSKQIEAPKENIEIEERSPETEESGSTNHNLRNMLHE